MDVAYFLNERIAFIRQFYANASPPFQVTKRKIEAEEPPFVPPYREDYDEPPFLQQWLEADESLHVLGHSCLSMLAAALHLYFRTWEKRLGKPEGNPLKADFKKGWLNGYRAYFAKCFEIKFEDGPSNLDLLEEIVLARNRIQHPDSITFQKPSYSDGDIANLRRPFFVDERETGLLGEGDENEKAWLFPPSVHVTEEKLLAAIAKVERFVGWLEEAIHGRCC